MRDVAFTWWPRELSWDNKVTYFGEFCSLNCSWIRKSITLTFMSSSRNKYTLFLSKLGNRCFCWFPSAMLVSIQVSTSMASPYKSLQICVKHFYGYLVYGIFFWLESLRGTWYIYLLSFPRFRTYLLNGFDFYFDLFWMVWHWKPAIYKAWDAMFHHQMKYWEESWKYDAQRSIFDELRGVSSGDEILCRMLDITCQRKWF